MDGYGRILMKTPVRFLVILMSLGLLAAGIYGTFHLEKKFDSRSVVRDDAYVVDFEDALDAHYKSGYDIDIINDDVTFDYTDQSKQRDFLRLDAICRNNPYLHNRTINWLSAFLASPEYGDTSTTDFYVKLNRFLTENPMYRKDIIFDRESGKIKYSRIQCEDRDINDWKYRTNGMVRLQDDIKAQTGVPGAYPITLNFFYRDMILFAAPETRKNLILSAVTILIITTPYLVHPLAILMIFGGFVALVFELFGLMALWGVALNSISMITSIMALGFAVDYSAHVAHAYLTAKGDTPEERMIETLSTVGASVLMGGMISFFLCQ